MAKYSPEEKELSVVLVGNFNPSIFHPVWFAEHEIISKSDLKNILEDKEKHILTHKQISQFSSSWFQFEVTSSNLSLTTTQEAFFEILLDLVTSTFSTLYHTPLKGIGLNLRVRQFISKENEILEFEKKYLNFPGFLNIDSKVNTQQISLQFMNADLKIGDSCNFDLTKVVKGDYLMRINQHFQLKPNANGKDLVEIIGKLGRKCIEVNEDIMKKILEN